jgi:glycosyltransferase involved in cell wall biosynthesis
MSKRVFSRKNRIAKAIGYFVSVFYDFSRFSDYLLDRSIFSSYEVLRKFSSTGKILARLGRRKRKSSTLVVERKMLRHPFQDGDLIFTCGLDWDYRVLENLLLVKQEKDVTIVSVVFDLIPVFNPELIQNSRHVSSLLGHFSSIIESSDLVLINSKFTQKQLMNLSQELGLTLPKTRVIPWGVTPPDLNLDYEMDKPSSIPSGMDFILAVGTLEIRKNYELLVQIVKLSQERGDDLPLMVFAGRPGWGTHDLMQRIRNDESLRERLIWLENASDKQLNWLYLNCRALLSPTFSEGFGLPVAESQAFQKKVILSDIPIYRELFPSALFASPFDPKEWLKLITNLNDSKPPVFDTYTWEESAQYVSNAIKEELGFDVGLRLRSTIIE